MDTSVVKSNKRALYGIIGAAAVAVVSAGFYGIYGQHTQDMEALANREAEFNQHLDQANAFSEKNDVLGAIAELERATEIGGSQFPPSRYPDLLSQRKYNDTKERARRLRETRFGMLLEEAAASDVGTMNVKLAQATKIGYARSKLGFHDLRPENLKAQAEVLLDRLPRLRKTPNPRALLDFIKSASGSPRSEAREILLDLLEREPAGTYRPPISTLRQVLAAIKDDRLVVTLKGRDEAELKKRLSDSLGALGIKLDLTPDNGAATRLEVIETVRYTGKIYERIGKKQEDISLAVKLFAASTEVYAQTFENSDPSTITYGGARGGRETETAYAGTMREFGTLFQYDK